MSRDRRQSPRLESLEGRQLLATARFDHVVAGVVAPTVLNGTLNGVVSSYKITGTNPVSMSESFAGRARSMGAVKAVVSDQVDANTNSLIGGTVVLSNPRGSVTLSFGPTSLLASQTHGTLSQQTLSYTVTSGTGAFAGATGSGTFSIVQNAKTATLVLTSS